MEPVAATEAGTNGASFFQFFVVAVLSILLATAELISRYKDEPTALVNVQATYLYLAFNALTGMAALHAIHVLDFSGLTLPAADSADFARIYFYQIVIAGLGGAAFFRTSVAKTRIADQEIGVGPAFVIDAFLAATDRAIDRNRAYSRANEIPQIMRKIPPARAADEVTAFCAGAMQNLSANDEKSMKEAAAAILAADRMSDETRAALIGFNVATYVGTDVLKASADELMDQMARIQPVGEMESALLDGPDPIAELGAKIAAARSRKRDAGGD